MISARSLILCAAVVSVSLAYVIESENQGSRMRRTPMAAHTMILIRGHPSVSGRRTGMEAYAAGSFYKPRLSRTRACGDCNQLAEEQPDSPQTQTQTQSTPDITEEQPDAEEGVKEVPEPERQPKAERTPKAPKPTKRPVKEEDGSDDDDDSSSKGGMSFRNFFPIMIGGKERGLGSATAIANSFSKGRGAIASSSATAYGSPDPSQYKQTPENRA